MPTPKLLRVGVAFLLLLFCFVLFFSELSADEMYGLTALQTQSCCLITYPMVVSTSLAGARESRPFAASICRNIGGPQGTGLQGLQPQGIAQSLGLGRLPTNPEW